MLQKKKEKKMPGLMFYDDFLSAARSLSLQKKGLLLEALIVYQLDGQMPDVTREVKIVWDFIYPRIQRDRQKYLETSRRRQYAAYTGDRKRQGLEPLSFEAWDEEKRAAEELREQPVRPSAGEDRELVEYWQQRVRDQNQARSMEYGAYRSHG